MVAGAGAIVHFGGIRIEDSFDKILPANIIGTHNVFEAARRHGVKRIVYASSVHAIGFYPASQTIDSDVPHRPDGYYGLSKAFAKIWDGSTSTRPAWKSPAFASARCCRSRGWRATSRPISASTTFSAWLRRVSTSPSSASRWCTAIPTTAAAGGTTRNPA
jgi:hypothetical protein